MRKFYIRSFFSSSRLLDSIGHPLFTQVNWDTVESGSYAVVNPYDSKDILYLTPREFKVHIRVAATQEMNVIVLATPSSSRPSANCPSDSPSITPFNGKMNSTNFVQFLHSFTKGFSMDTETLILLSDSNIRPLFKAWCKTLSFWMGGSILKIPRDSHILVFIDRLCLFYRKNGPLGLCLRLKISFIYVVQYLAGMPRPDPWALGHGVALDRSGLPKWLPLQWRRYIRERKIWQIRFILSVLGSYKGIQTNSNKASLDTVQAPPRHILPQILIEFKAFCIEFWAFLELHHPEVVKPASVWDHAKNAFSFRYIAPYMSFTSCPSASPLRPTSGQNMIYDTLYWAFGSYPNYILHWFVANQDHLSYDFWLEMFRAALISVRGLDAGKETNPDLTRNTFFDVRRGLPEIIYTMKSMVIPIVGRLCSKIEAAGKVRVFAIVDGWTQRALKPVHDWIFGLLKILTPMDATFDQEASLKSLVEEVVKYNLPCYSYDLKAATDLIPQTLYIILFGCIWGENLAQLWMNLLVNRDYHIPKGPKDPDGSFKHVSAGKVRYTVGQPMGALSSWSSLAILHHVLVQFAAFRCGYSPMTFGRYRILGDDVVICNRLVAENYLQICKSFHISIGLAKSYVSETNQVLNFANQTYIGKENISPVSLKEEFNITSPYMRLEMVVRMMSRYFSSQLSVNGIVRLFFPFQRYSIQIKNRVEDRTRKMNEVARMALALFWYPSARTFRAFGVTTVSVEPLAAVLTTGKKVLQLAGAFRAGISIVTDGVTDLLAYNLLRVLISAGIEASELSLTRLEDALMFSFFQGALDSIPLNHFLNHPEYGYLKDAREKIYEIEDQVDEVTKDWFDNPSPTAAESAQLLIKVAELYMDLPIIPDFSTMMWSALSELPTNAAKSDQYRHLSRLLELSSILSYHTHQYDTEDQGLLTTIKALRGVTRKYPRPKKGKTTKSSRSLIEY